MGMGLLKLTLQDLSKILIKCETGTTLLCKDLIWHNITEFWMELEITNTPSPLLVRPPIVRISL